MPNKNRVPSITRWPLDHRERVARAATEVDFFVVMSEVVGDEFITPKTQAMYDAACRVMRETMEESKRRED